MKTQNLIMFILIAIYATCTFGQAESISSKISSTNEKQEVQHKHSIGASLLMISNLPQDLAEIEEGAPNYIFEPSLKFGFKF